MAQASLSRALRRTVFRLAGGPTTPDEQLLARFVARQDDEAFAQLVRRHGPTVLGRDRLATPAQFGCCAMSWNA